MESGRGGTSRSVGLRRDFLMLPNELAFWLIDHTIYQPKRFPKSLALSSHPQGLRLRVAVNHANLSWIAKSINHYVPFLT